MKWIIKTLGWTLVSCSCYGQLKISQYPETNWVGNNVMFVLGDTNLGTNFHIKMTNLTAQILSSNNTVYGANIYNSLVVTNGLSDIRTNPASTITTNQIDASAGPVCWYWTNMVTNIVLQFTNVWPLAISNRTYNFFFTGATNTGPNYTVSFNCPNPAGVLFRWGINSPTNGNSDITVTNNKTAGASLTFWSSNVVEGYFQAIR